MPDWPAIFEALRASGIDVGDAAAPRAVGGGSISAAWRIVAADGPLFLKTGDARAFEGFDAEADGLRELQQAEAVRVPKVLACGRSRGHAYLALEWLSLERGTAAAARRLGHRLAAQHRQRHEHFGWHRDNTIGGTPQINTSDNDWIRFFREQRLGFQLDLAARNGYVGELQREGRKLADRIERLFGRYRPQPSLLHGDLWGGNQGSVGGEPVLFDPAVYYGDRESDIAMARLFGGFDSGFYRAYEEAWPLADGHRNRTALYQLYHVLNHLNLFGVSYLDRALELTRKLNEI